MKTPTRIGTPPWSTAEILSRLEAFERLYEDRPIQDNQGGMQSPHLFATWFMAKQIQPTSIIESGVWKGQGSWFLEQACPEAEMHSIDLNLSKRMYISKKIQYYNTDFSENDWSSLDPATTLVFLDDHQNAYTRLMQCKWFGFKHVIFEDNYPPGEGDFYTMKQAFAGVGFGDVPAEEASKKYQRFRSKLVRRLLSTAIQFGAKGIHAIPQYSRGLVPANSFDAVSLERNLEIYYEFPPVFRNARMSLEEEDPIPGTFPTEKPLLDDSESENHPALFEERAGYNWLCYARLR